jgi:phosphoribosylaminoimidazole-succinocarboxamide synthase
MGATLSPARANVPLLEGLKLEGRGKVRDTYGLSPEELLSLATDGISIFDFVLNATVPLKGIILNAMNHFWSRHLRQFEIDTHLVAVGPQIDRHLPTNLRGNVDLQCRASVISKMRMAPVEFIYRSVLTGSAVSSYKQTGTVCGHKLPAGLQDGDALPCILDTPTTKAEEGHDENMFYMDVRSERPQQTITGLQIFQICSNYCESRGIKLADTKFEFGVNGRIGDEICTPDSSRFWEYKAWLEGRKPKEGRKAPPPYDKQLVRAWGIEQGINKKKPEDPEDVAWVHSLQVPQGLIGATTQTYRYIFWRLTGLTIEDYLRYDMGIEVPARAVPKITIIAGSESDLPVIKDVLGRLAILHGLSDNPKVHVMSCHRNPHETMDFAGKRPDTDVIICAGSKALALPGVMDAFAHASYAGDIPVIGVALGQPGSRELLAAQLSIEELPGAPVIMDEIAGHCYTGADGLAQALIRVVLGELPPARPRQAKPVKMNALAS